MVHLQLQQRRKRGDETYQEYCYKMMEIGSRVKMEVSAVIQYIIDGIQDDKVNKIILYGAKNISELKRKLEVYETMKNKSKQDKTDKNDKTIRKRNWYVPMPINRAINSVIIVVVKIT